MSGRVLEEEGVWAEPLQSQQSSHGRSRGGGRGQVRASSVSAKRWFPCMFVLLPWCRAAAGA